MEPVDEAVLATERYGSQETWKYRLRDGVMKRERLGEGSFRRGSSITAAFKVSCVSDCVATKKSSFDFTQDH